MSETKNVVKKDNDNLKKLINLNPNSILSENDFEIYKTREFTIDDLYKSAISDENIIFMAKNNYITVDNVGYCINYPELYEDKKSNHYNKRIREPKDDTKYVKPPGQCSRLYRPPILPIKTLLDKNMPILITEGEKKAIKATQEGFPCLAISGVTSWKKRINYKELLTKTPQEIVEWLEQKDKSLLYEEDEDKDIIPDVINANWQGKTVILCFDSDMWHKPQVKKQLYSFACYLMGEQRATVKIIKLPKGDAKGIDDFIIANGVDAFKELYDNAEKLTLEIARNELSENHKSKLKFPIEVFPPVLSELFVNLATKMDAPIEYIAMSSLVCASIIMDGYYQLDVLGDTSWFEYPILWVVIIGTASQKKTPCLNISNSLINIYNVELYEEYKYEMKKYNQAMVDYKILLAQYKKDKKGNAATEAPILPEKPSSKMLTIQSTTKETLVTAMAENGQRGIGIINDELAGFFYSLGRYKTGKGDDEEYFLQAWKKQAYRYKRKTTGEDYLLYPSHNILGTIQPKVLNNILFKGNFETTNGMIERWLYICTDYEEKGNSEEFENTFTLEPLKDIYDRLYANKTLKTYKFSPEAKKAFIKFKNQVVEWKKSNAITELTKTYLQKQTDYVARISLILHAIQGNDGDIELKTLENAIKLSNYFLDCFDRVADIVVGVESNSFAMDALNWLKVKGHKVISPSQLHKNRRGTFKTVQMAKLALDILADTCYGRMAKSSNGYKFHIYL